MKWYKEFVGIKSLFFFCSLPLRLDTYKGCPFGCRYCFSQQLNNRDSQTFDKPIPANPAEIENWFLRATTRQGTAGPVVSCVQRRVPFHIGCLSDPLQPLERSVGVTHKIIMLLQREQYPFVICTKSAMIAEDAYLELCTDAPCSVQISFSTFNNDLAAIIEPGAPSPNTRIRVLERLSTQGIYTVARIQPFLYPIERLCETDIRRLADAGVKHLVLEHLRIPTNSSKRTRNYLWEALGMDIISKYKRLGLKKSRISFELASEAKLENVILARDIAHRYGMTFGSGDNDFHHFSDSFNCCGTPHTPHFANQYSGHLGRAAWVACHTGALDFSYIDHEWHPNGSVREYLNSDCRIAGPNTVKDLLHDRIDNPYKSNSPTSFFGVRLEASGYYNFKLNIP